MYSHSRGSVAALWLVAALGVPVAASARDVRDRPQQLHVSAGRLGDVLAQVSRQSGMQVVTSASPDMQVERGVSGRLRADEALRRLLLGLPLAVRAMPGGYLVTPASRATKPVAMPVAAPVEVVGEPIIVTGYRESLRLAVAVKHTATGIVEVTCAEDVAAFPDPNAADALQRLPGIAISRDSGEGRQVSLRGLGPLFTRTTLNGMEALATTASGMDNRGSASRQRRFDYSVFDAALFSGIEVRKAWSAQYDAGGVGGTVALHTLRPFDRPDDVSLLAVRAASAGNAAGVAPRFTAELSRRSGSWGLLLAASYSRNSVTEYGYRNWDWVPVTFGAANIGPDVSEADRARLTGDADDPVYMSRGQSYSSWSNRFDRLNLVGAIEHEDANGLHLALDAVHARLNNDRKENSLAAAGTNGLTTSTVDGTQVLNSVQIVGDTMVAGDFSGVDMRSESKITQDRTAFTQLALSAERPLGDTKLSARVGYARSDFSEPIFDKAFLESTGKDFAFVATGAHPRNRYGFDVVDASNWTLMRADAREDAILNENVAARIELSRYLAPALELKAGATYRFYGNDGYERRVTQDYGEDAPLVATYPLDIRSWASYVVADVDAVFAATGQSRDLTASANLPGMAYRVRENSYAAFALARWNLAVGAMPAEVELGLQYLRTDTSSSGEVRGDDQPLDRGQRNRHEAWLPSLRAWLDVRADLRLRFAFSRDVNQPDVADLRAAAAVNSTPFGGTVETGNPSLRPFTATALDLVLEHYIGRDGYASLGAFYKRMDSFITSATTLMPYSQTGLPTAFLYSGVDADTLYNVVRPLNGSGASILGVEASVQRDLHFLPAPFDRLGVQTNATFASGHSDVLYDDTAVSLPLIDLSRWSGNATLYYTGHSWDARVALAYRGTYRDGVGNNGNIGTWIRGSTTIDFAAHAMLRPGLQASIEARNLTDTPIEQYTDRNAKRLLARTRSGRTIAVGLRYAY
ncbi:TonB-dependent receptor [Novosphingobium guangzhouense]|uniref:TonB-dependent receptor plug domain-containing protein n=1 Tax=Novosphingobium guangzhouense TaxID=1850347 RepID=A0A2K2FX65_9SPHN|nr:TonB-dependent receptor [Novosphingobium guangzhouense]PNU03363.1 hypothetical protein A8V01_06450 [Novosphingobium guangzhouense]